jgi:hypothetical protein
MFSSLLIILEVHKLVLFLPETPVVRPILVDWRFQKLYLRLWM